MVQGYPAQLMVVAHEYVPEPLGYTTGAPPVYLFAEAVPGEPTVPPDLIPMNQEGRIVPKFEDVLPIPLPLGVSHDELEPGFVAHE